MEKKQIEIFPGVTVSESMAIYVEHTKWKSFPDIRIPPVIGSKDSNNWSKKSVKNILGYYWEIDQEINPKLGYLGFSSEETDELLREVGGDVIIKTLDTAECLNLLYAHSLAYQERKVLFRAIAYCTQNESILKYLPEVELGINNITSLMPIEDLCQIVLGSDKFLPNYQIGPELNFRVGYTAHRN